MSKQFRNAMGSYFLKELFFETTLADKTNVIYTLKEQDHTVNGITYPSLYRLYLESDDPTEYSFARAHLGGWTHWKKLCNCSWFQEYLEQWREELETRLKSISLKRIMVEAKTNGKEAFSANKYLLEKGWVPKEKSERGRPSKEEIQKRANDIVKKEFDTKRDAERLGIQIN